LEFEPDESIYYCKHFLEGPVESLANRFLEEEGLPRVFFGRNYDAGIRPVSDECQEFFIDTSVGVDEFKALKMVCKSNLKIDLEYARKAVVDFEKLFS